ncbi:hypothetical protein Tco_1155372, partial [Tanacetum coccineum]
MWIAERARFTVEERAKFLHDTIIAQGRFLAEQRAIAIRNKPPTRTQLRNQMMTYLKHVGNKKHSDLKNKTFEDIQDLYEKVKRVANETSKKEDTAKVHAKVDVTDQGTKKRKGGHIKMLAWKRKRPQSDVDSDDEHKKYLKIVTFKGTMDSEIMERKYVIARLNKDLLQRMLNLGLEVERESTAALDLIRFIKQKLVKSDAINGDEKGKMATGKGNQISSWLKDLLLIKIGKLNDVDDDGKCVKCSDTSPSTLRWINAAKICSVWDSQKVNPLVIPGVCFTKLIINHLQSIHKFHKRPGSPLHLPYLESFLGYLKFSFKNTKRVRFRMAILDTLIYEDIRSAPYYSEYVAKVTKYLRYLAGEVVSDDEAPASKPAKGAKPKTPRKPKPQSISSQPPKPKPAPAKPQEKKRKLVMDTTEVPSPAKRSKAGKVVKKQTLKSSKQLVDEFVDEGVPGPLPPVVIREPEPGKYEPLPEVQGKGKEKVGEEQAAQVLLNLQTPKKKNHAKYETESDNEASRKGQAGSSPGKQVEDQAASDLGKQVEGQAGSDPGVAEDSQIQPSHVVHAGPNLEHMNLEVSDTSPQPNPEQMDEEFTTTAYPNVQENLKLPTEGEVRLEEPASSAGTLSSMQNLDKELSFTNQFLAEKSQEDEPEKTNTKVEVQSMVTVPIHQDTSSVPLMTSPIIDLTVSQPASTTVQASIPTSTATVTATTTTTTFPPPPPQPQQGISNSIITQRIGELEQCIADLVEERLDKQGNRMYQLETQDLSGMIKEQIMEYMRTQEVDRKINETVKEAVTASVQYAMRAPLRACLRRIMTRA